MKDFFIDLGCTAQEALYYSSLASLLLMIIGLGLFAWSLVRFVVPLVLRFVHHTSTTWDDYLLNEPVLHSFSRLIPAVIFNETLPYVFDSAEFRAGMLYEILSNFSHAFVSLCIVLLVTSFLKNLSVVSVVQLNEHHLVGVLQFLRLLTFSLGGIVVVALIFGYNPLRVIAGLSAAATVLLLVFKDTILGLVAGIQLSMNKMLKVGDWITVQRSDINGIVEHVNLTTIKVRNFDNTVSTIPPYTLVSEPFQNWSGMFERQGRRVKRSLYIDISTIRFTTEEELERLRRRKFIVKSESEEQEGTLTNITLFRRYAERRLQADPEVKTEQWVLVRQLNPTLRDCLLNFGFTFVKPSSYVLKP